MENIKKIKVHAVETCKLDDSILDVAKILKNKKERRVFVVDNKGILKGIITTTDLVYKALAEDKKNLKAKDIMTKDVKSIEDTDDLDKALEIMHEMKNYTCPITKKGKIIGLLSYHDIVGYALASMKK